MTRLQYIWEQAIQMQIGPQKDVEADRILFLFDSLDKCVYPAMIFEQMNLNR